MLRSALLASLLLSAACKTTGDPPAGSSWIHLEQQDGLLTIPLAINGQPARAAFASAEQMVRVDAGFVEKIGLIGAGGAVYVAKKPRGPEREQLAGPFTLAFVGEQGPQTFANIEAADVLDESVGTELLISPRLFRGYVLQIDYPGSRFRYLTRSASKIEEEANTKMRVMKGRVQIRVEMNGHEQWLFLDPSAGGAITLPRIAMGSAGLDEAQKIAGETAERYVISSLKIGPFELENVRVEVQDRDTANTAYRDVLWYAEDRTFGRIGLEVLQRFIVTLDFDRELLHLYSP